MKEWGFTEIRNVRELLFAQRDRVCRKCMAIGAGLVFLGLIAGGALVLLTRLAR